MSQVSQDLQSSGQRVAAIQQSVKSFNAIAATTQSLITELTGTNVGTAGNTLNIYSTTIYDGTSEGCIADRKRFLEAHPPATPDGYTSLSFVVNYPGGSWGTKSSYTDDLADWNITAVAAGGIFPNPLTVVVPTVGEAGDDRIATYCGAGGYGVFVLSAMKSDNVTIYTQDVYNFCVWNSQYQFVCRYLWETPIIAQAAKRQCNGLMYSLSTLSTGITYQQSQLGFENDKQTYLTPLV